MKGPHITFHMFYCTVFQEQLNRVAEEEEERHRAKAEEERRQQMKIEEEKRLKEEREKAREGNRKMATVFLVHFITTYYVCF